MLHGHQLGPRHHGPATSWLVFSRANGSGTYLGATWATTSLRQTGADTWERVDSCA